MRKRHFIPFLLTAVLILMLIPAESTAVRAGRPVFSESEHSHPEVILEATNIGSRVKLTVSLGRAQNVTKGKIFLTYDIEKLIYISCTAAPIGGAGISNAKSPDRVSITWDGSAFTEERTVLATLEFKTAENVKSGAAVVFVPCVHEVYAGGVQIQSTAASPLELILKGVP